MFHIFFRRQIDYSEGRLHKIADGMTLAGSDDIIRGLFLLQHQPHRDDVILGPAPISPALQAAELQFLVEPARDPRYSASDFARNKIFSAPGRFVIVEDPVANEEPVRFAIDTR